MFEWTCHISVFCFSLQLGMVQNLYQCWCGLRFFFARVYCICMRVLIAHVRFAEWVYLWEKLCERIRGLFPSFEQQLLKSSIIWTCYLCDLLPSDDSLCYLWLYLSCFWWCMLLMHEDCGKRNWNQWFLLKGISVHLPCFWLLLVLSWLPCWPYKGKGPFLINQLVKSQKVV